jgi:hypothetical protein
MDTAPQSRRAFFGLLAGAAVAKPIADASVFDELHAHANRAVFDAVASAGGRRVVVAHPDSWPMMKMVARELPRYIETRFGRGV